MISGPFYLEQIYVNTYFIESQRSNGSREKKCCNFHFSYILRPRFFLLIYIQSQIRKHWKQELT
jgi:hypothetical protein